MNETITFDESAAEHVLRAFEKQIDEEGYIVDAQTGERETTKENEEIRDVDFIGLERGSIIFLDDDFNTLVEHVKRRRED